VVPSVPVAYVAVARKLLHTIHGLLRTRTSFDQAHFYQPQKIAHAA
jgi:hypothetical protein